MRSGYHNLSNTLAILSKLLKDYPLPDNRRAHSQWRLKGKRSGRGLCSDEVARDTASAGSSDATGVETWLMLGQTIDPQIDRRTEPKVECLDDTDNEANYRAKELDCLQMMLSH